MKAEKYLYKRLDPFAYQFYSRGSRGVIVMIVIFTPIDANVYNLGFGALNRETNEIDDSVELRNGDTDEILGTVAQIALDFLSDHPSTSIYATGSCAKRTRKYQMGINKYYSYLAASYTIQGFLADKTIQDNSARPFDKWRGEWQTFQPGINYNAFLLSRN